jgi:hypothetical protein
MVDAAGRRHACRVHLRAKQFAPLATVAFSVALLAAFDWLMSLEPLWYSTIFGVYMFAGCTVGHAAVAILLALALQQAGLVRTSISVEHYPDLGKLLFGWLSFWAYIAFVQCFLIWYANIPDELSFFHLRWTDNLGSWKQEHVVFVLHFLCCSGAARATRSAAQLGFGASSFRRCTSSMSTGLSCRMSDPSRRLAGSHAFPVSGRYAACSVVDGEASPHSAGRPAPGARSLVRERMKTQDP